MAGDFINRPHQAASGDNQPSDSPGRIEGLDKDWMNRMCELAEPPKNDEPLTAEESNANKKASAE
jgi:hypothetical protein